MGKSVKEIEEKFICIDIKVKPAIGWSLNQKIRNRTMQFNNLIKFISSYYVYVSGSPRCNIKFIIPKIYFKTSTKQVQKILESEKAKKLGIKSFQIRELIEINITEKIYKQVYASKNWKK